MARRVAPRVVAPVAVPAGAAAAPAPADSQPQGDSYLTRLIKYIPAEIIAIYVIVEGFIKSGQLGQILGQNEPGTNTLNAQTHWLIFAGFLIATPIYTFFATRQKGATPATGQIIISIFSFAAWAFALGGPFENLDFYAKNGAIISAVLLPVVVLVAGAFVPKPQPV